MALVKHLGMLVVILTITKLATSYAWAGEYIYDVSGYGDDGSYVWGEVEVDSYGGIGGYIYNGEGEGVYVYGNWDGYGEIDSYGNDGNYYYLEVD